MTTRKSMSKSFNADPASSRHTAAEALDDATGATTTREERIRLAAYAAAEQRGFATGFETDDWLEAERRIDADDESDAAPGPTA
jgi:hypothetical protein